MTDVNAKAIAIRDYLRDNIEDPIHRPDQWIHYDTLDSGLESIEIGKSPAVFIERVPSIAGFEPVGTAVPLDYILIDITVIVRNKDTGRISNVVITSSTELMDDIIKSIDEQLLTNSTSITGIAWVYRFSIGGTLRPNRLMKTTTWRYIIH